ncbi:TerC family protein [Flavobacterium sp. DSP2-3-1]
MKQDGKPFATSLFLVLVLIETTDLIFSADSIRVILASTQEHFIVHT